MIPKRYTNIELCQLYYDQRKYFPTHFVKILHPLIISSVYLSYWVDPLVSPTGKYMLYRENGPAVIFTNGTTEWHFGVNLPIQAILQEGSCACWEDHEQHRISSYLMVTGTIVRNE